MTWREATGVERADVSAETGEVKVRVTGGMDMDPEKLCCLLQEATKKKCVRIVLEESVPSPGSGRIARPGQTKNTSVSGQVRLQRAKLLLLVLLLVRQPFCPETDRAVLLLLAPFHVPVLFVRFSFLFLLLLFVSMCIYLGHESFGIIVKVKVPNWLD